MRKVKEILGDYDISKYDDEDDSSEEEEEGGNFDEDNIN